MQWVTIFYAFTGCNTVSSIFGISKCTLWDSLLLQENLTELLDIFQELSNQPESVTTRQIDVLEIFVQRVYYPKNLHPKGINKERLAHFNRQAVTNLRTIPFSRLGLTEHIKRSCIQGGWLWQECIHNVLVPDITLWGWQRSSDGGYLPSWQQLEDSIIQVADVIQTCSCRRSGCKSCRCIKNGVTCLPFCGCERTCKNS